MRRGPDYGQWVDRLGDLIKRPHHPDEMVLRLPLEVAHEWEGMKTVNWRDNGDGSYTLTPSAEA